MHCRHRRLLETAQHTRRQKELQLCSNGGTYSGFWGLIMRLRTRPVLPSAAYARELTLATHLELQTVIQVVLLNARDGLERLVVLEHFRLPAQPASQCSSAARDSPESADVDSVDLSELELLVSARALRPGMVPTFSFRIFWRRFTWKWTGAPDKGVTVR